MAKVDNRVYRPRKKKNSCCTFLFASLVFVLIIMAAGVGVGWYFGDQWTRENLDMSLSDVVSVFSDIKKSSDKGVITNKYNDADLDAFYGEIRSTLLIRDEEDVSYESMMEIWDTVSADDYVMEFNDNNGYKFIADNLSLEYGIDISEFMPSEEGSVPQDQPITTKFFMELLNKSDTDKLFEASEEDLVLSLTDKSIAAMFSYALEKSLNNGRLRNELEEQGLGAISDKVKLEQVSLYTQPHGEKQAAKIRMVVSVKALEIVENFAASAQTYENVVNKVAAWYLDEKMYFTLDVGIVEDLGVTMYINNMTDKQMNKFFKLVSGLVSMNSDKAVDIKDSINEMYKNSAGDFLGTANEMLNFSENVSNGTLSVPLYGYILDSTFNNTLEADGLEKIDVQQLLEIIKAWKDAPIPGDGDPSDGDPGDEDPSDGDPSDGDPSDGDPSDGDPSDGDPSDGDPSDGAPDDGDSGE